MNNKNIILIFIILIISLAVVGFYFASNSKPLPNNNEHKALAVESTRKDNSLLDEQPHTPTYTSFEGNEFIEAYPELEHILKSTESSELTTKLEKFLSSLPDSDIKEAANFIANATFNGDLYEVANTLLIKHWASISPAEAFIFSESEYKEPFLFAITSHILITGCDQAHVINSCILQISETNSFEEHIIFISNNFITEGSFAKSLLWANALSDEEKRTLFLQQQGQKWISEDPEAAFLWSAKQDAFITIADQAIGVLVQTDAWHAYNLVTQTSETYSERRSRLYEAIVKKLIEDQDFLTLASILESSAQHEVVTKLARQWVEADPEAALTWALNYEDFHSLSLRAIDKLTKTDHHKAFELSLTVPDHRNDLRQHMFNSIFSDRAENNDFASIDQLLKQLPRSEKAEDYYPSFINQWSWEDPGSAANAVLSLPNSEKKSEYLTNAFQTWSEKDPQSALSTLESLSESSIKESVTSGVLQGWALSNSEEAANWVASQSSSNSLDASLTQASLRLVRINKDKSPARKLANTISDQELRNSTLGTIEEHVFSDLDID